MPINNVFVTSSAGVPNMLPGVTFTPPSPSSAPPAALPAGVPALGLNVGSMTVTIHGNVRAATNNPGVVVQVV